MNTKKLQVPFIEKEIHSLKAGERVLLSGEIFTARDRASEILASDQKIPFSLENSCIFHCGPAVKKEQNNYRVLSAGPTSSIRMERFLEEIINKRKIKSFLGKGGFPEESNQIFKKHQAVYLSATGGAGALLAEKIKYKNVFYLEELGACEAIWQFQIKDFPCFVSVDSGGNKS